MRSQGKQVVAIYPGSFDPVTLGPDGTAYVGTKNGLMAIRDGQQGKPGKGKNKRGKKK